MKGNLRLAAVMFTDIVGYSKLISLDEERTVNYLVESKNYQKEIINGFGGIVWKDLGDGIMATFDTIRDSIKCAEQIAAKSLNENRLNLRIGIHLCDITEREGDIYGQGVNIASRVMEQAGTNKICISEAAYLTLCNHNFHRVEFKGKKRLKNIPEAIGVYELIVSGNVGKDQIHNGEKLVKYFKKRALVGLMIPPVIQLATNMPVMGPLI
jgi:class 3 adenylate cyclase